MLVQSSLEKGGSTGKDIKLLGSTREDFLSGSEMVVLVGLNTNRLRVLICAVVIEV